MMELNGANISRSRFNEGRNPKALVKVLWPESHRTRGIRGQEKYFKYDRAS